MRTADCKRKRESYRGTLFFRHKFRNIAIICPLDFGCLVSNVCRFMCLLQIHFVALFSRSPVDMVASRESEYRMYQNGSSTP